MLKWANGHKYLVFGEEPYIEVIIIITLRDSSRTCKDEHLSASLLPSLPIPILYTFDNFARNQHHLKKFPAHFSSNALQVLHGSESSFMSKMVANTGLLNAQSPAKQPPMLWCSKSSPERNKNTRSAQRQRSDEVSPEVFLSYASTLVRK